VTAPEHKNPRFGKFEVLQLLGRGGMAEVYKARIVEGPRSGQLVALKRLSPKLSQDSEALDLFTGEADISRLLRHPNIVQVFETGVVGDLYYLAMEYVDGRDLAAVLSRCRERRILLPATFAVHIARATLDALAYAHSARGPSGQPLDIIHCDVSPSNLFISRSGEIKLGDFGIAKVHAHGDADPGGTLWGKVASARRSRRRPISGAPPPCSTSASPASARSSGPTPRRSKRCCARPASRRSRCCAPTCRRASPRWSTAPSRAIHRTASPAPPSSAPRSRPMTTRRSAERSASPAWSAGSSALEL
jgi:serine/threonine protein kinase